MPRCERKTAARTRRLPRLSQHRQFVESDGKLHRVTTLPEQFPGISPYVSEMGGVSDALRVRGVLMLKGLYLYGLSSCSESNVLYSMRFESVDKKM